MSEETTPSPAPTPVYGPPAYAVPIYAAAREPKGLSITSMVLGLVSIAAGFTFVVPVVGLVLGVLGLRKEPAGRGMALTGAILCSVILSVWALLILGIMLISLLFLGGAAISTPHT
ncbi:hypothetical protein [Leifsonia sp. AG29]|uniref:hypothetical protein n=1 Tax=Leifsonia sp. AG29 TaxID=2598860 RepID=UPI00131B692C|nr:hypothetical protein [Leifsonia sp. AG29]